MVRATLHTDRQITKWLEQARRLAAFSPGLSAVASRNAAESILAETGAAVGLQKQNNEPMIDYLRRLKMQFPEDIYEKLQRIRLTGNAGAHGEEVTESAAKQSLAAAEDVAAWYQTRVHIERAAGEKGQEKSSAGWRDHLKEGAKLPERRSGITREEPPSWNIKPQRSNLASYIFVIFLFVFLGTGVLFWPRSEESKSLNHLESQLFSGEDAAVNSSASTHISVVETVVSARERLDVGSQCAQSFFQTRIVSTPYADGSASNWGACVEDLRYAAENGYPEAYSILGRLSRDNANGNSDIEAALISFESAAVEGVEDAFGPLSGMLLDEGHPYTDLSRGFDWALRAAKAGDRESISRIVWLYVAGTGTDADFWKAEEWAAKAAALDMPRESCWLAHRLLRRGGDEARGKELLLKHQNSTELMCQSALGQQLARGGVFEADYRRAIELLRATSELGDPDGSYVLGQLYEHGLGTPPDPDQAEYLYRLSHRQGQPDAGLALGFLLLKNTDLAADQNIDHDGATLLEGATLLKERADNGNVEASAKYGEIVSRGLLDGVEVRSAQKYLQYAADNGNASAKYFLGRLISKSRGDEGWQLMREAADLGVRSAAYEIGMSCVGSDNLPSDFDCATKYLKTPADQGDAGAAFTLATLYLAERRRQEAFHYFERSGELGFSLGYLKAGTLAMEHPSDRTLGLELLKVAATREVPGARLAYGKALISGGGFPGSPQQEEGRLVLKELATSNGEDRVEAMFQLAQSYKGIDGFGFHRHRDIEEASRWYWSAHVEGHPQALAEYNRAKTAIPFEDLVD